MDPELDSRSLKAHYLSLSGPPLPELQNDRSRELIQSNDGAQVEPKLKSETPWHQRSGKVIQGAPKILGLLQVQESRISASLPLIVRENESPWDTFQQVFSCKLAGTVLICVHRTRPSQVQAIRQYPTEASDKVLQMFRQIRHENIISARECYRDRGQFYAHVDDLPLTLEHLTNLHISQNQLSSIISQILNGLSHLIASGVEHTDLTCSNILLGSDGTVKIAALELCEERPPSQFIAKAIKDLAIVTMRLMQKYEKDDGLIGVDDVDRWPLDSCAVDFLTTTSSAPSIEALKQHPFVVGNARPRGELVGLARFALIATKTFHSNKV